LRTARIIFVRAVAGTAALLTAACTISRDVNLYPTNEQATSDAGAVLHGKLVGHGQLRGTVEITMPDGELLQGEYSIVANGSMSFGSVFNTVYGSRGATTGSATSTNFSVAGQGQGVAALVGARGTSMQCEFLNNNMTGHGYGACQTVKGATYRMMY